MSFKFAGYSGGNTLLLVCWLILALFLIISLSSYIWYCAYFLPLSIIINLLLTVIFYLRQESISIENNARMSLCHLPFRNDTFLGQMSTNFFESVLLINFEPSYLIVIVWRLFDVAILEFDCWYTQLWSGVLISCCKHDDSIVSNWVIHLITKYHHVASITHIHFIVHILILCLRSIPWILFNSTRRLLLYSLNDLHIVDLYI